jgi:hypothetical protein
MTMTMTPADMAAESDSPRPSKSPLAYSIAPTYISFLLVTTIIEYRLAIGADPT